MRSHNIKVGDLVHHSLYLRTEWIALLLELQGATEGQIERAYVKMVPGTMYEDYFYKTKSTVKTTGWVYSKWLWVYRQEV